VWDTRRGDLSRAGISQAWYLSWKKKYDGLLPTEMKRLKQLEDICQTKVRSRC
jgi:hypothetical protein